jgi:hypothetical protein
MHIKFGSYHGTYWTFVFYIYFEAQNSSSYVKTSYLTENTLRLYYEHQPVNLVAGNHFCIYSESLEMRKFCGEN